MTWKPDLAIFFKRYNNSIYWTWAEVRVARKRKMVLCLGRDFSLLSFACNVFLHLDYWYSSISMVDWSLFLIAPQNLGAIVCHRQEQKSRKWHVGFLVSLKFKFFVLQMKKTLFIVQWFNNIPMNSTLRHFWVVVSFPSVFHPSWCPLNPLYTSPPPTPQPCHIILFSLSSLGILIPTYLDHPEIVNNFSCCLSFLSL